MALSCPCHHILYEGTRGPGKTDAQLMYFRRYVGQGYGQYWRGIIFDRQYKNLDDLIGKSQRWFPQFNDGARFLRSKSDYRWIWPTGEELLFRQIQKKEDYWNYHGQEFAFIGWNELCKFPTSEIYDTMMSCNRTSFLPSEHSPDLNNPLPNIKLTVFATTNPYGPGHGWVKRRFIDVAPPGVPVSRSIEVFNPRTQQQEVVTKTQVRIFGSYRENRYLTPEYVAELESVKEPSKREAWLKGNWNIVAGGVVDDLYNESVHVLPQFPVPPNWVLDRSFDWGSSKPFSVGFWAVADGSSVTLPNKKKFTPARGSLIRYNEWYGCAANEDNTGLFMSSRAIAKGIRTIEMRDLNNGWIHRLPAPGPADGAIFDNRTDNDTIAEEMATEDIRWNPADKSQGSRVNGLETLRSRLEAALTGEGPAIYFMDNCKATLRLLPTIPRDPDNPDDADSESEDHVYDEIRYRVLAGSSVYAVSIPTSYAR